MVRYLKSMAEFEALVIASDFTLCVVDFTATWCAPCKTIAPVFEQMAEDNPDVLFVKVDVDDASDITEACNVTTMPTFQFYKSGEKVGEFSGANKSELEEFLAKYK